MFKNNFFLSAPVSKVVWCCKRRSKYTNVVVRIQSRGDEIVTHTEVMFHIKSFGLQRLLYIAWLVFYSFIDKYVCILVARVGWLFKTFSPLLIFVFRIMRTSWRRRSIRERIAILTQYHQLTLLLPLDEKCIAEIRLPLHCPRRKLLQNDLAIVTRV